MSKDQSSYRQIFKATSIFGGVQFVNIIVQIIRSKAIAVLVGPSGMGIFGLITSTIALIAGFTNFGLGTSAIREISVASNNNDEKKLSVTIAIFRKLVWLTGFLGLFVTLIGSPIFSHLTFNNNQYTWAFACVSISLLFMQLTTGQNVVMQGLRKLDLLAKANIYAAIISLIITLPIYYFYKIEAIIPAIIVASIVSFLTEYYFASKLEIEKVTVDFRTAITKGKGMLTLGFVLSLSSLIALGASYIIRVFITRAGSIVDVGLYSAGFAIINNYVGLIFTAMATDYYPKLAGVSGDKTETRIIVNQQSEIAILILAPLLCSFLVFIKFVIVLLYSNSFLPIEGMIHWAILGIFFKTVGWALGFVLITNGSSKLYFWSELIANCYILVFNIVGYHLYGLTGLGASFLIGYFIYFLQNYFLCNKKFQFSYTKNFWYIFFIQLLIALACFAVVKLFSGILFYAIGILMICISISFSLMHINKLINLRTILQKILKK